MSSPDTNPKLGTEGLIDVAMFRLRFDRGIPLEVKRLILIVIVCLNIGRAAGSDVGASVVLDLGKRVIEMMKKRSPALILR